MAETVQYPAVVPHRLIVTTDCNLTALQDTLNAFEVVEPLTPSHTSAAGKYLGYGFTVRLKSYDEMCALDSMLRQVPGVKMII